jgi:glycerol-3-phosphate acyltransferase PlsY
VGVTGLEVGAITTGYFLGAIPFAVLISRFIYGVDIRTMGSKNAGATNVWRTLGAKPGVATLALDILKGVAAVLAAKAVAPDRPGVAIAAGLAAIIGHNWSVFLNLKGGKGVATSAGVFLALMPLQALIALATFLVFFLSTRHVSVGSMAGAAALIASSFLSGTDLTLRVLVVVAGLMIVMKHVPNLKRLARGEEPKVSFR